MYIIYFRCIYIYIIPSRCLHRKASQEPPPWKETWGALHSMLQHHNLEEVPETSAVISWKKGKSTSPEIFVSLFLSLSLYIHMYIHVHV